ncbi:MAG TPA: hypothetical protein VIB49_05165 [Thermoplasmata archaeon]
MSIPLAPAGKTLEAVRIATRSRFFLASVFLASGALLLSLAKLLLAAQPVGFLSGLILASLLLVLGLSEGALSGRALGHAFPLSEFAAAARGSLLAALALFLPLAALASAGWAILALPSTPIVLIPSLPLFWAPPSGVAAIGLVTAARELASERMAVLGATGSGFVLSAAVFSVGWSLVDARAALESPLFSAQLLLVGAGFLLLAISFSQDAWVARGGRRP